VVDVADYQVDAITLAHEVEAVEAHHGRADLKAGLLLGLNGAAAGALVVASTGGAHLRTAVAIPVGLSVAAFAVAAGLLTMAVRPAVRAARPYGFALYATLALEAIPGAVRAEQSPEALQRRLQVVSRAVASKYRRIRLACDASLIGLVASGAALVALVVTHG
jgi:hypothetical protein